MCLAGRALDVPRNQLEYGNHKPDICQESGYEKNGLLLLIKLHLNLPRLLDEVLYKVRRFVFDEGLSMEYSRTSSTE